MLTRDVVLLMSRLMTKTRKLNGANNNSKVHERFNYIHLNYCCHNAVVVSPVEGQE